MNNLSIAILVCILIVLCIISLSNQKTNTEMFRTSRPLLRPERPYKFYKTKWDDMWNLIWFRDFGYTQRPYRACDTCAHKTRRRCADCTTCGWCTPYRGAGKCEPGNEFGPYLRRDCFDWDYGGKSSGLY